VLIVQGVVEFNFSNNKLGCFPEELREFGKLEHLEISNNPIANLNSSVVCSFFFYSLVSSVNLKGYLSKLEFLEAKNCSLYLVDINIGMLRHLVHLDLSGLSVRVHLLINSHVLTFSENPDLTSIPAAIGDIRSLEVVNLSGCRLITLPKELFYNVHLRDINVSKNKIAVVPPEIGYCKDLVWLIECCNFFFWIRVIRFLIRFILFLFFYFLFFYLFIFFPRVLTIRKKCSFKITKSVLYLQFWENASH
jgi:Leucine-rich repeat (LRR) protein